MARCASHTHGHFRRRIVPGAQFSRVIRAILALATGGPGRVVCYHNRLGRKLSHKPQCFQHAWFRIPVHVSGPGFALGKPGFNAKQTLSFVMGMRNDEAGVIGSRRIEFHAIELDHVRNNVPGLQ